MIYSFFAVLPFLVVIGLLVFRKMRASLVMGVTYFLTLAILFFVWRINEISLFSYSIMGFVKAVDIFLIIFSVLLLFDLLRGNGNLEVLKDFFRKYTRDKNVIIVLIGWFFVSFFEAIAGFGTPAAICAPLLVFLGFRPLTAVIITLVADSVAVPFGAFGTPILGGLKSFAIIHSDINFYVGVLNFFVAIFMPLILLFIFYKLEGKPVAQLRKYVKFALFSGVSFALPYAFGAFYIGSEVPAVLGSLVGLGVVLFALDKNFLISVKRNRIRNKFEIFKSVLPYVFLILLLILTRVVDFVKLFLKSCEFEFNFLQVQTSLNLYSPWFLIFFTFVLFALFYNTKLRSYRVMFGETFLKSRSAFFTLVFTLMFVELLVNSANESLGILSVPNLIGILFSNLGVFYVIFAPFLGAFGAFIAGSATVSNIIFSPLQAQVSNAFVGFSTPLILGLQSVGAGAGNMIAIHNIVAVCTLVGVKNKESNIIRTNVLVVLLYCFVVGVLGFCVHLFDWYALYVAVFN